MKACDWSNMNAASPDRSTAILQARLGQPLGHFDVGHGVFLEHLAFGPIAVSRIKSLGADSCIEDHELEARAFRPDFGVREKLPPHAGPLPLTRDRHLFQLEQRLAERLQ